MLFSKNNVGFTLVEMIIAVGMLMIVCVFSVKMFIYASNVERKAYDTDNALFNVEATIESFKVFGTFTPSEKVRKVQSVGNDDGQVLKFYYNSKWERTHCSAAADSAGATDEDEYVMIATARPVGERLWEVTVVVNKIKPYPLNKGESYELVKLSSKEYF